MEGWPLAIVEATIVRTASQRVALVTTSGVTLADDAEAHRYRDTLEATIFSGVDVVLLGTEPSGGVRFVGAPTAVASLQGTDIGRLRFHRFDLGKTA